ncbi:MAG TPA: PGPGW domain-containing protein [Thermoanaerobaculia bacterium]|nr:PGPGW domain-containing protein [Thermoanaerobaculia bacterium]
MSGEPGGGRARPSLVERLRGPHRHPPDPLPLGWRVFFYSAGVILLLIGIAGLALPGLQGILTIVLALALISMASETMYWLLRRGFRRWPRGWKRMERIRRKVYRKLGAAGGGRARKKGPWEL